MCDLLILAATSIETNDAINGGGLLGFIAIVFGLLKCMKIARRETTHTLCVTALALVLFAWLCTTSAGVLRGQIPAQMVRVTGLTFLVLSFCMSMAAFVVAVVGLSLYRKDKYTQGRAQAFWALVLSIPMVVLFSSVFVRLMKSTIDSRNPLAHIAFEEIGNHATSYQFPEKNVELRNPGRGWVALNAKKFNPSATLVLTHTNPNVFFMMIAETGGTELNLTNETCVELAQARIVSLDPKATFTPSQEQILDHIPGLRYQVSARIAGNNLRYDMWLANYHGYQIQLLAWALARDQASLKPTADDLFSRFKLIDPDLVAHAGGVKEAGLIDESVLGYTWDMSGTPWLTWLNLEVDIPQARSGISTNNDNINAVVVPVILDDLDPTMEQMHAAMMKIMVMDPGQTSFNQARPMTLGPAKGIAFEAERDVLGLPCHYQMRIVRCGHMAYFIMGWAGTNQVNGKQTVKEALDAVQIIELKETPALSLLSKTQQIGQASINNNMGITAYRGRRYTQAADYFRKATLQGSDPTYLKNWLQALTEAGDLTKALAILLEQLPRFANDLELKAYEATLLNQNGLGDKALAKFKALYENGFDDVTYLKEYLNLLLDQKQPDRAMEVATAFEKQFPSDDATLAKVSVLRETSQYKQATEVLVSMQSNRPFNGKLQYELAEIYLLDEQPSLCAKVCEVLIQRGYNTAYSHYLHGRALLELGLHPQAKDAFEKAVKEDPTDRVAKDYLDYVAGLLGQGENILIKKPITPVAIPAVVQQRIDDAQKQAQMAGDSQIPQMLLRADGIAFTQGKSLIHTHYRKLSIPTQRAVDAYTTLTVDFDPLAERVFLHYLRVIDAQGNVLATADINAPYVTDAASYVMATQDKTLHMPVPGLAPGTVIEYAWSTEDIGPTDAFPYQQFIFNTAEQTCVSSLFITGDVEHIKAKTFGNPHQFTSEGVLGWIAVNPARYQWETYHPDITDYLMLVVACDLRENWETLGSEYLQMIEQCMVSDDSLSGLAQKLTGNDQTSRQRLATLADYVRKNLTYKAIEFGVRALVPNKPAQILSNKYGDCKDHALMLHLMLKAVNIPSSLVLIHTSQRLISDLPSLDQFDHMILHVPTDEGDLFIDTTDKSSPPILHTPLYLGNKDALVLDPGKVHLKRTPPYVKDNCRVDVDRQIAVDTEGEIACTDKITLHHQYAYAFRQWLNGMEPSEYKNEFLNVMRGYGVNQISEIDIQDADAQTQPMSFTVKYNIPQGMHDDSDKLIGTLPFPWELYYIEFEQTDQRDSVFAFEQPIAVHCHLTLRIPEGYTLADPEKFQTTGDTDIAKWQAGVTQINDQTEINYSMTRKAGLFAATRWADYQSSMQQAIKPLKTRLVIQRK